MDLRAIALAELLEEPPNITIIGLAAIELAQSVGTDEYDDTDDNNPKDVDGNQRIYQETISQYMGDTFSDNFGMSRTCFEVSTFTKGM